MPRRLLVAIVAALSLLRSTGNALGRSARWSAPWPRPRDPVPVTATVDPNGGTVGRALCQVSTQQPAA